MIEVLLKYWKHIDLISKTAHICTINLVSQKILEAQNMHVHIHIGVSRI